MFVSIVHCQLSIVHCSLSTDFTDKSIAVNRLMFSVFARTLPLMSLIFKPINGSRRQNLNSVAVLLHTDNQAYKPGIGTRIFFDFLLKFVSERHSKNRLFGYLADY